MEALYTVGLGTGVVPYLASYNRVCCNTPRFVLHYISTKLIINIVCSQERGKVG